MKFVLYLFYNSTSSRQTPFKNFYFPTGATYHSVVPVDNGNLSCWEYIVEIICDLSCNKGFVPEKPHVQYIYNKFTRTWTTRPEGGEFPSTTTTTTTTTITTTIPSVFCVKRKSD